VRLAEGERLAVDGVLDEAAWQRAVPATGFAQIDPENGAAATEQTEVRVVFDRDRLYLGVHCFDSTPARLLGNQMVRDGPLAADDRFMWVLDPYFNQRGGYFFEINPSGAMGDGLLVAPAAGGGTTSLGFGLAQNRAWDGIWLARVRRHDRGWSAEIEIPFRTLNFDPNAPAWGANFQRTVRRKNERACGPARRNQGLQQPDERRPPDRHRGRHPGRRRGRQAITSSARTPTRKGAAGRSSRHVRRRHFLQPDAAAQIEPDLNTDFAQTEVDDRQVNLTRFRCSFEKRDFFSKDPAASISPASRAETSRRSSAGGSGSTPRAATEDRLRRQAHRAG
jgi:hypothetical protein